MRGSHAQKLHNDIDEGGNRIHTHKHTYAQTHIRAHASEHTRTHTHTHPHTQTLHQWHTDPARPAPRLGLGGLCRNLGPTLEVRSSWSLWHY